MTRYVALLLGVMSLIGVRLSAQQPQSLTNEAVIQLVKAEVTEDTIVKFIRLHMPGFDLSASGIVSLKRAGVSDKIIQAMLDRAAEAESGRTPTSTRTVPDRDPTAGGKSPDSGSEPTSSTVANSDAAPRPLQGLPKENGIYYEKDGRFTELFGKPVVRTQTAGFAKTILTAGMSKVRSRSEIPGEHAQLQIGERQPVFYVLVPEGQSPEALTLVELDREDGRRRFQIGSAGGITGRSDSGYDLDKVRQVRIERVGGRAFRIMPDEELKPGEYGFVGAVTHTTVGVASAGVMIYDFGIQKKK